MDRLLARFWPGSELQTKRHPRLANCEQSDDLELVHNLRRLSRRRHHHHHHHHHHQQQQHEGNQRKGGCLFEFPRIARGGRVHKLEQF